MTPMDATDRMPSPGPPVGSTVSHAADELRQAAERLLEREQEQTAQTAALVIAAEERARRAEERAEQAELCARTADEKAASADHRARAAEEQSAQLAQQLHGAQEQVVVLTQRVEAVHRQAVQANEAVEVANNERRSLEARAETAEHRARQAAQLLDIEREHRRTAEERESTARQSMVQLTNRLRTIDEVGFELVRLVQAANEEAVTVTELMRVAEDGTGSAEDADRAEDPWMVQLAKISMGGRHQHTQPKIRDRTVGN
jgi:chromosome segregation ATPase